MVVSGEFNSLVNQDNFGFHICADTRTVIELGMLAKSCNNHSIAQSQTTQFKFQKKPSIWNKREYMEHTWIWEYNSMNVKDMNIQQF